MSGNVVDELIIKLGFDQTALAGSANKVEGVVEQMSRRIGGILGAVFSIDYMKNLITSTAQAGTKMEVLSKMTGEGVEKLQAFQQAVIRMGGSAEGFNGTITKLKDSIQDVAVTGGTGIGGLLAAVGISARDAKGNIKGVADIMLELSDVFKRSDNTHAQFLQRQFGIDDNTFLAMKNGSKELKAQLDLMIKQGVMSEASARQQMALKQHIDDLNQSWTKMRYNIADKVLPTTYDLINVFMQFGNQVVPKVASAIGTIQDTLGISNKAMIDFIAAIAIVGGSIATIGILGSAFGLLATGVTAAAAAAATFAIPFIAVTAAVYGAISAYKSYLDLVNGTQKHTSEMEGAWNKAGVNPGKSVGGGVADSSGIIGKPSSLLPQSFVDNLDATAYSHMMKESGGDPSKIGYKMHREGGRWVHTRDSQGNKIPEAYGLFQLTPAAASEALGKKVTGQQLIDNPQLNKQARDAYLAQGYRYTGSDAGAYAYYNGGPGGGDFFKKHGRSMYGYSESVLANAKASPANNQAIAAKTPQLTQAQNTENNTSQSSTTNIDTLNVHGMKDLDGVIDQAKKYNDPFNLTRATNNFQGGLSS